MFETDSEEEEEDDDKKDDDSPKKSAFQVKLKPRAASVGGFKCTDDSHLWSVWFNFSKIHSSKY